MIDEEYDHQYLVRWGKIVNGENVYPAGFLVKKDRIYNIKERKISKFRYLLYKYWDNNFY